MKRKESSKEPFLQASEDDTEQEDNTPLAEDEGREGGYGTEAETIAGMFLEAASRYEGAAFTWPEKGEWKAMSFADAEARVREIAKGLIALGIEAGDRVAIFAGDPSRVDPGRLRRGVRRRCHRLGLPHELRGRGQARAGELGFASRVLRGAPAAQEGRQRQGGSLIARAHRAARGRGGRRRHVPRGPVERGKEIDDGDVDERVEAIEADDLFTLIYTSGTTGPPKGCMLTNENFRSNARMVIDALDTGKNPVFYIFLPLAHTLTPHGADAGRRRGGDARVLGPGQGRDDGRAKQVRPTHFPAVPRIFEKIYNEAISQVPEEGPKQKLFQKGIEMGRKARERE